MTLLERIAGYGAVTAGVVSLPLWWCALVGWISGDWVTRERRASGARARNPIVVILWTHVRWSRVFLRGALVLTGAAVGLYGALIILQLV